MNVVQCRLCEHAHGHPLPRMMVVSPMGLLHIVDHNGMTLCGHIANDWTWKDTTPKGGTMEDSARKFNIGDKVWAHHNNRSRDSVVVGYGKERYELIVKTHQGDEITVHVANVEPRE